MLNNINGEISISVNVTDGNLDDFKSFILNVIAQPDPPVFMEIEDQQINEDEICV